MTEEKTAFHGSDTGEMGCPLSYFLAVNETRDFLKTEHRMSRFDPDREALIRGGEESLRNLCVASCDTVQYSEGAQFMFYTRTGDDGKTSIFDCDQRRISKASEIPEALGALDELNALLGFVKVKSTAEPRFADTLREIQENLFIIQAEIAGDGKRIKDGELARVEELINEIEKEVPAVKGFSIAGGTELSALLDMARTITRRAEQRITAVVDARAQKIAPETQAYINRLSSLLFALARLANHRANIAEEHPHY